MKSKILENIEFAFTGSNVLAQIQDNSTPNIDLLVRESIQNSIDAVSHDKEFIQIDIIHDQFNKTKFESYFNDDKNFKFDFNGSNDFLVIADKNTTGLLGGHKKNPNESQNLFNLVYDIMNQKNKSGDSGGSWGIGKSVYYRFGEGFCVYYTRTKENGVYVNKLAITFIEDETKDVTSIKVEDNRGIAFFGDLDNDDKAMPIYDENYIKTFLSIFNLDLYEGDQTGTMVIIPFFQTNIFINNTINKERKWWNEDFVYALDIAIQRWYFSRLNNNRYDGKYLNVKINNDDVILNKFFDIYQKMYNLELTGDCFYEEIIMKSPKLSLGKLIIKKFNKTELFMNCPDNYPSPCAFLDLDESFDREPMICYLRKPGMVITHDEKWKHINLNEDEYLLGIFKLNDEEKYENEFLGGYVRSTEVANHKKWIDAFPNGSTYSNLYSKKPISRIWREINSIIINKYKQEEEIEIETSNSRLRKKLGNLLLPPTGFGKEAGRDNSGGFTRGTTGGNVTKTKPNITSFDGFENGCLKFTSKSYLNFGESATVFFHVSTGSRSYSFEEWTKMNFELPCLISSLKVESIKVNKNEKSNFPLLDLTKDIKNKKIMDSAALTFEKTLCGNISGITIKNINQEAAPISSSISIYVKPLDDKYSIAVKKVLKNRGEA